MSTRRCFRKQSVVVISSYIVDAVFRRCWLSHDFMNVYAISLSDICFSNQVILCDADGIMPSSFAASHKNNQLCVGGVECDPHHAALVSYGASRYRHVRIACSELLLLIRVG